MTVIRRAAPADAAGIGKVYVESWRATYPGLIPDGYLLGMSEEATAERWTRQLAQPDAEGAVQVAMDASLGLVGFGSCGLQRTRVDGYVGEVFTLYLLDVVQGCGLGRRLMAAMAAEMLGRGVLSALVWVLRDNPSRWFYERLGGRRVGEQSICLGRVLLPEIAYGWSDLTELARLPINPPVE